MVVVAQLEQPDGKQDSPADKSISSGGGVDTGVASSGLPRQTGKRHKSIELFGWKIKGENVIL